MSFLFYDVFGLYSPWSSAYFSWSLSPYRRQFIQAGTLHGNQVKCYPGVHSRSQRAGVESLGSWVGVVISAHYALIRISIITYACPQDRPECIPKPADVIHDVLISDDSAPAPVH